MMVLTDKGAVHCVCKDRFVVHHGTPRRVAARRGLGVRPGRSGVDVLVSTRPLAGFGSMGPPSRKQNTRPRRAARAGGSKAGRALSLGSRGTGTFIRLSKEERTGRRFSPSTRGSPICLSGRQLWNAARQRPALLARPRAAAWAGPLCRAHLHLVLDARGVGPAGACGHSVPGAG